MELPSLGKTPEDILYGMLEKLTSCLKEVAQSTNNFSASVKGVFDNDTITNNEQLNSTITKLQNDSKSDLQEYHNNTIAECDTMVTNIQKIFECYKLPYNDWCTYESRLQRETEDHQNSIKKLIEKHEKLFRSSKQHVEQMNKAFTEIKDSVIVAQEDQLLRNRHRMCQRYSLQCIVLFIPRQTLRFLRYLSFKSRCRRPQRTSSYETLVRKKETQSDRSVKDIKLIEDAMKGKTDVMLNSLQTLINSLVEVSNGISYIFQDLCRLDYLEANKEKHYEIMGSQYESIMKNGRLYIASLVQVRSNIAMVLKLNETEESEEEEKE